MSIGQNVSFHNGAYFKVTCIRLEEANEFEIVRGKITNATTVVSIKF